MTLTLDQRKVKVIFPCEHWWIAFCPQRCCQTGTREGVNSGALAPSVARHSFRLASSLLCKSSLVLFQRHLYTYHRKTRFSARFDKDYQVLKSSGKFENPSSSRVLHRFYSNRARTRSLNPPGVNLYTLRPSLVVALLMFISRCRYRLSLFSTDAPAMVRGVRSEERRVGKECPV